MDKFIIEIYIEVSIGMVYTDTDPHSSSVAV